METRGFNTQLLVKGASVCAQSVIGAQILFKTGERGSERPTFWGSISASKKILKNCQPNVPVSHFDRHEERGSFFLGQPPVTPHTRAMPNNGFNSEAGKMKLTDKSCWLTPGFPLVERDQKKSPKPATYPKN